jgi:tRNA pseudouridine38-40 synthase
MQKDIFGNDLLVFEIEANAFLWKMVRTITGTLINLDKTNAPEDSMQKILLAKDRTKAGVTAPSTGLFLYKIHFDGIRKHV